jgi:hypothetical protein
LSDKYADYTNDYVKPALAYFVKCEIVSSIAIDMSNSGIAIANPQYQSAASDKQRQRLYDSEMSKAKTLLDFALEYIAAHSSEFPDFRGNAPKKHHRVAGLILGNGPSVKPSSISGEAYKGEIDRLDERIDDLEERIDDIGGGGSDSENNYTDADKALVQTIPNKADKNGNYPNMTVGKAQGVVGISQVQETLTVETKPNGNIVIGNLAGQIKEFMPATPSGDPMHYAYEAAGAVWNGDTGYWELNREQGGLANITTSEMRVMYNEYSVNWTGAMAGLFAYSKSRTNLLGIYVDWGWGYVTNNTNWMYLDTPNMEIAYLAEYASATFTLTNAVGMFFRARKLNKIIGVLDFASATAVGEMFVQCYALENVRCANLKQDISFADSPLLSKESLLYMIHNCASGVSFTITLHPDVYAKCQEGGVEDWIMDINNAIDEADIEKETIITLASA